MLKSPGKRDVLVLAVFVPLVSGGYLYAQSDLDAMQASLEDRADDVRAEWFAPDHTDPGDFHTVMTVDSYKTLTYFGEGRGMVHLFTTDKDNPANHTLLGVEYHYVREDGRWRETDSMRCENPGHYQEAIDTLQSRGVELRTQPVGTATADGDRLH